VTRARLPFLGRVRRGVDMLTTCEGVNWGGRHGETATIHQSNVINEADRDDHRFDLALKLETVLRLFRVWRLQGLVDDMLMEARIRKQNLLSTIGLFRVGCVLRWARALPQQRWSVQGPLSHTGPCKQTMRGTCA
jgi:hypothetical protein